MAKELGDFIEAAGLLEYDPAAITKIYKGHPLRLIKRLWQTLIPIGFFLISIGIDKITRSLNDINQSKQKAKDFTNLLVQLGPAFIKAGQALSTRPDIVPGIVLEELSQLQDQLPGFDCKLAMACIKEDLGKDINNIFQQIDKEPISAASLGQVHKAILKDGTNVAVKIQRPGLREQITLDLYIVRNIAIWLKKHIKLIRSDLVALIDELGKRVFEEMDYINEASNAKKFKKLHQHNPKIAVPKIYEHATSKRILTMEWIDGVKLTSLERIKAIGIDPNEMIDIGVNCSLQQLLEHGFFHADPHPGNLLALPDGRLCFLDFGMMSEITKESRTGLIQAVVHLVNKNFEKLSQDFVKLGFLSKNVDLKPIAPAFEIVFTKALEVGVNKMDFKSVTDDLSGVMYKLPFRVPPYYALIIRSLITLEGIALSVNPDFKILGAAYPYFARRLMEDPDPQLRTSLKEMLFEKNSISWDKLEDLIQNAASNSKLNLERLIDQTLEFMLSKNGHILREEVIEILAFRVDNIGLYLLNKLKYKFNNKSRNEIENIKPSKNLFKVIKKLPGFKINIVMLRLPRIFLEQEGRKMGQKIAKRVAEINIVRLIRYAANTNN